MVNGEVGRINERTGWQALRVTPVRTKGVVRPSQRGSLGDDVLSQKGNIVGRLRAKRPTMGRFSGRVFFQRFEASQRLIELAFQLLGSVGGSR